jgi:hypothetical protein
MKTLLLLYLQCLTTIIHSFSIDDNNTKEKIPKVLLLCFDGFRADFVTPTLTPFLWQLGQRGVFAPGK